MRLRSGFRRFGNLPVASNPLEGAVGTGVGFVVEPKASKPDCRRLSWPRVGATVDAGAGDATGAGVGVISSGKEGTYAEMVRCMSTETIKYRVSGLGTNSVSYRLKGLGTGSVRYRQ